MTTVTIAIDDDVLEQGRQYAQKHNLTFEDLMRQLLTKTVRNNPEEWAKEWQEIIKTLNYRSGGKRDWKREDLYRV